MYDKQFTPGARGALRLAQAAAGELGHGYVGSEHLLLGVLQTEGPARCCLQEQEVTPEKVRGVLRELVGAGFPGLAPAQGLTPRARRIIENAAGESTRRGERRISTEHLLLGILRESGAMAIQALRAAGADPGKIQAALIRRMGGGLRLPREAQPKAPVLQEAPRARVLEQFTRSLSTLAREGRLDPVLGREKEIARTIRILSRRTKNNPVLIGEPGVGKTAVVEGLAQRIAAGDVPGELMGLNILSIDLAAMLAGTKYRGEFEERVRTAIQEVQRMGNVVLFIDELHNIVGAGSAEGAVDAANLLKPALSRSEIRVIGATTLEEYRRHIEKDAALERRFQPVTVEEPSPETAVAILEGLREKYEAHHGLTITDGAIRAAVTLSRRYLPERFLPDKAIDLVDEACSRVRLEQKEPEPDLRLLEERVAGARRDKETAAARQDFERAAAYRDAEENFARQLREERKRLSGTSGAVREEDIAAVAAEWTGIPVSRITESESQRLLHLEEVLRRRVVGQEEAVSCLCRAIRRSRVGLKEPGRPVGSFLLLGPTGVGKTEVCRSLAHAMFGQEDALIRFDMSEYAESHTASRLVGAPPGYVGHDDGGQLTEKIRRRPYSLVLFDEIEKAHQDVWNLLLQIMEDGCLTDSHGRKVDFRNAVIAMTSNVGARHITGGKGPLGFAAGSQAGSNIRRAVEEELKHTFRPEFLNRVDETIIFRQLTEEDLREIARRMLSDTGARMEALGLTLQAEDEAVALLAREGLDRSYGARPLRRLIRSKVEDPAAEGLLSGRFHSGDHLTLTVEGDTVTLAKAPQQSGETA